MQRSVWCVIGLGVLLIGCSEQPAPRNETPIAGKQQGRLMPPASSSAPASGERCATFLGARRIDAAEYAEWPVTQRTPTGVTRRHAREGRSGCGEARPAVE